MNALEKERRVQELEDQLMAFHRETMPLTGIVPVENRLSFAWQLIDSIQRVEYVATIRSRPISPARVNPASVLFDPLKAAILLADDDPEEAFWLIFLATHCGRNLRTEWLLARELYGIAEADRWTWQRVSANPAAYGTWLHRVRATFQGKFGNHRKYESLKPGHKGTAAVIRSYVDWIQRSGSHQALIANAIAQANGDARLAFGILYRQMGTVIRFGRTGRFDYLTMLAKVGLADIDADSTYMNDATGPKRGARLLFDGQIDSRTNAPALEAKVAALEQHLGVGMQVMEDSMCNWQKSPNEFLPFRG
ncbi:MAG: hypothetical protein ACJ8G1_25290 [Vitreoscilla sp.]